MASETALTEFVEKIARTEMSTALYAVSIVQVEMVRLLVRKGAITDAEFKECMSTLQKRAASSSSRKETPELFDALTRLTMFLEQVFSEAPSGKPS